MPSSLRSLRSPGAGQLLSAPTAAQLRMGQAVLQLRPALTDGGLSLSSQFQLEPQNVERVHAPFTVVNACPCDILCQFNPPVQKHMLGKEKESLPVERGATIHLVVDNGFGGEVVVPNCGHAEVTPIRALETTA
eukprot:Skav204718  [mRNA]  locus=scaffold1549:135689:138626:+ [translate_table: standard]